MYILSVLLFRCDFAGDYMSPLTTKHRDTLCFLPVIILPDAAVVSSLRSRLQMRDATTDTAGYSLGRGSLVNVTFRCRVSVDVAMTIVH